MQSILLKTMAYDGRSFFFKRISLEGILSAFIAGNTKAKLLLALARVPVLSVCDARALFQ